MNNSLFDTLHAGIQFLDNMFGTGADPLDQVQQFIKTNLKETPTARSDKVLRYENITRQLPCGNMLSFRDDGEYLTAIFAAIFSQREGMRPLVQAVVDRLNQLTEAGEWEFHYREGYFAITFNVRMKARPFDESVFTTLLNVVYRQITLLVSITPSSLFS